MDPPALPPLLRLPGELRNAIYTFIFQEPNKIILEGADDTNQLKLVCRQLYHETAWFELHCNEAITFVREIDEQAAPATQFIAFTKNFPSRAFENLNTVVLAHAGNKTILDLPARLGDQITSTSIWRDAAKRCGPPENLVKLAEICRAHPNITCRYILPAFSFRSSRPENTIAFILAGIYWTYAIRREKILDGSMASSPGLQAAFDVYSVRTLVFLHSQMAVSVEKLEHMAAEIQDLLFPPAFDTSSGEQSRIIEHTGVTTRSVTFPKRSYDLLRVPNLKFSSSCTSLDEGGFREGLLQCRSSNNETASFIANGFIADGTLDKWVAKARQWVEDSI